MKIKRSEVDSKKEGHLLTSLITSDEFCRDLIPLLEREHFQTPYSRIIFKWINDYYDQYGEAPKQTIKSIYEVERGKLEEEDASLIEIYLGKLSEDFEGGFNKSYSLSQAESYIRERSLAVHVEKVGNLLKLGRVEEAEQIQSQYQKIARVVSDCINPNDEIVIDRYFNKNDDDYLLRFPGSLGEMTGDLKRSWLVIIQGKYKGGKTQLLQAIRNLALKNRLKVFDASLEMPENAMLSRHFRSMTGLPEDSGTFLFPAFDCYRNQINVCKKNERTNSVLLYNKGESVDETKVAPVGYRTCTYCRKKPELKEEYQQAVVYRQTEKYALSLSKVKKKAEAIKRIYGDCLRFRCYPRGTANVDDIKRDLDILEYTSGWIPDVILVDYLQILKPEYHSPEMEEQKVNDSAVALSGLASERKTLIVTASQVKTAALGKTKTRMGDASNSARAIYAHSDLVLGISRDENDKHEGILLANVVAARHKMFNENMFVKILQQLDCGNPFIDSQFVEEN